MKTRLSPVVVSRTVLLFFFLLAIIPSCQLFHFDKINPYNDFTSDHLPDFQVNKIKIIIPDSINAYPGSSFPIGVIAVTSKRKELKTRGLSNGFVNWSSYVVRVEGGTFDNGIVTVKTDPRLINNHLKISITPFYSPQLKQEIELPLSYKTKFIANCKGQNGLGGFNGLSGTELHQLDSNDNRNYYDGRNGQAGTDGETANDGCVADVFVKAMNVADKKLMNVLVINHCDNSHSVFWIDPDGGSLLVDVSGGDGGDGGNGGDGENGTNGTGASYYNPYPSPEQIIIIYYTNPPQYGYANCIDLNSDPAYEPTGNGGDGGIGGNGGNGGFGGNGGVAVIHLDSSAVEWKNKIIVENSGGKAGKPGVGGYAGKGGLGAYLMLSKYDGKTGYIGANGVKATHGKPGGETIWRVEKVKMAW